MSERFYARIITQASATDHKGRRHEEIFYIWLRDHCSPTGFRVDELAREYQCGGTGDDLDRHADRNTVRHADQYADRHTGNATDKHANVTAARYATTAGTDRHARARSDTRGGSYAACHGTGRIDAAPGTVGRRGWVVGAGAPAPLTPALSLVRWAVAVGLLALGSDRQGAQSAHSSRRAESKAGSAPRTINPVSNSAAAKTRLSP